MNKREIPFRALGGILDARDVEAVHKILLAACEPGGDFFPLPEEAQFQEALATHEGARRAIVVNSCGTALDLCMMALGVGEGDEVITTPLTFVCTAGCAVARGARVVFGDVDPVTLNLDPASVRRRITERTRAIIAVHYAGLSADLEGFEAIERETGIPVIYDAAHAVGARHQGRPIGGAGKASCYSFQSNKNMTCLGEGGAVLTDDESFAEKVRLKKTFGYVYGPQLRVTDIGFNYRMTKPQCAAGLMQLSKLARVLDARRAGMTRMDSLLEGVEEIIRPAGHGPDHGSHLYVIRLDTDKVAFSRDEFRAHLKEQFGIATVLHYPPVWSWEAFSSLGYSEAAADCPRAAKACRQLLSLPIFPTSTTDELEYIGWAIREALAELKRSASPSEAVPAR